EYAISSLRSKSERSTLIVDACRGVQEAINFSRRLKTAMANEALTEAIAVEALSGRSSRLMASAAQERLVLNRLYRVSNHRSRWDSEITNSLIGAVEMLACSKGQTSGEDASAGGYYTSLLMQSAERWNSGRTQPSTHTTKDAHDYAASMLPAQQTPEY